MFICVIKLYKMDYEPPMRPILIRTKNISDNYIIISRIYQIVTQSYLISNYNLQRDIDYHTHISHFYPTLKRITTK